jgi:hypothetical protein
MSKRSFEQLEKREMLSVVSITPEWLSEQGPSPYHLTGPDTTYVLETDVETPGTAFAIIDDDITFDLNSHTITYDNADPIDILNGNFEEGLWTDVPGWDTTNAPGAMIVEGTYVQPVMVSSGSQALRFSVSTENQHIISTQSIVLDPNTTYTISGMCYNQLKDENNNNNLTVYVGFPGTDIWAGATGRTRRGYAYMTTTFDTGPLPETYTIMAGINHGDGSLLDTGNIYLDDIRIQRTKTAGIALAPDHPVEFPDIRQYGDARNTVIKNGNIVQGVGAGDNAHGIYAYGGGRSAGSEIFNTTIEVYGAGSMNVKGWYGHRLKIHNNDLYNNVTVISSRDNFRGSVINLGIGNSNEIYNNTIIGGCQNGIVAKGNAASHPNLIHNNYIALQSRYTNGFGIQLYGDQGAQVYENTLDYGDGDYSGRGIFVGGGAIDTKIYDNTIITQELPRNQEYNGYVIGGAYGIQVERSENIEVYGNNVTVYAREIGSQASAFRMNAGVNTRGVHVHDNSFTAVRIDGDYAYALSLQEIIVPREGLLFENNVVTTNDKWLAGKHLTDLVFQGNTWAIGDNLSNPWRLLRDAYWREPFVNLVFLDNQYLDDATRNIFVASSIVLDGGRGIDPRASFHYSWTLDLNVISQGDPVIGASVLITNNAGSEVFSEVTTGDNVEVVLDEFLNAGGIKTTYNPYTIVVAAEGYESSTQQITLDQPTDLTIDLVPIATGIPIAENDTYTLRSFPVYNRTYAYHWYIDGVLANDWDPDGDALTAILVDRPEHGQVYLWPNGGFYYWAWGDVTFDTFTYYAFDGTNRSALATVELGTLEAIESRAKLYDGVYNQIGKSRSENRASNNNTKTNRYLDYYFSR